MKSVRPDCPPEAAARLASRRWRIRHSAWLLPVVLGLGVVTAVGFAYIAIRARNARWWKIAAAYLTATVVVVALSEISENSSGEMADWVGWLAVAMWGIAIVHGLALNREWLRWCAGQRRAPHPAAPLLVKAETGLPLDGRTFELKGIGRAQVDAGKSEQLLLCEQVVLIAYDSTGSLYVGYDDVCPKAAVAGAVVLDLVVAGLLQESGRRLVAAGTRPDHRALARVHAAAARRWRPRIGRLVSRCWFSGRLDRAVAKGLAERGSLRAERRRVLRLIPVTRYPPRDTRPADRLRVRLRSILLSNADPTDHEVLLIAVLHAGRLLDNVFGEGNRQQAHARAETAVEAAKSINTAVAAEVRALHRMAVLSGTDAEG